MAVPTIDLTSYSGLVGTVAAYLNRQDLNAQIPAFIAQHEAKMNRELRVRDMQTRAQSTTSGEYITLPGDYLQMYTLELAQGSQPWCWSEPLRFYTEEEARAFRARHAVNPPIPTPAGYTIFGNEIELIGNAGTDAAPIAFRLKYHAKVPGLSALNSSNWLLIKSPDLYVVGACLEAAVYLKNDERLQTWSGIRASILDAMTIESERALKPQAALNAARRSFG